MVTLATAVFAAVALAQGWRGRNGSATPPDPQAMAQMRVNRLTNLLSLTDAQKASALTLFTNAYTASQAIQSNLRTARTSLWDAVKQNQTGTIDTLASQIGNYEGQVLAIDSKAEAAFRALLTADQQKIFDSLPGRGMGGPMGPGGPMGRGRMGPAGRTQ